MNSFEEEQLPLNRKHCIGDFTILETMIIRGLLFVVAIHGKKIYSAVSSVKLMLLCVMDDDCLFFTSRSLE